MIKITPIYGIVLAISYILTILFWWFRSNIHAIFTLPSFEYYDIFSICWPIFKTCRPLGHDTYILVYFLIITIILSSLSFIIISIFKLKKEKELNKWDYSFLVISFLSLFSIYALDYRLSMNQLHMIFWTSLVYFFSKDKITNLKILIILFYFSAGFLKLNHEWISGHALFFIPWPFNQETIFLGTGFVILLELCFIWGLISKYKSLFIFSLISLTLFHLISWQIVGFYYPLLMLLLLSIFPLTYKIPINPKNLRFPIVFIICQIIPYTFKGDKSLTGEGRIYALHMFDAKVTCQVHLVSNGISLLPAIPLDIERRNFCDPIVYLSFGRQLCRETDNFTLELYSKKTTDTIFSQVLNIENFCTKERDGNLNYHLFSKNTWINAH